ncbi:Large ribosomal subunit protein eL13y-like protein [Drosera capensis]
MFDLMKSNSISAENEIRAGNSAPEELASANQAHGDFFPAVGKEQLTQLVKVTEEMKSFDAYSKLRLERTNKRKFGARQKKPAEAEKEDKK